MDAREKRRLDRIERDVQRLMAAANSYVVRQPAAPAFTGPLGGTTLRFALVGALHSPTGAWTDFATDGWPYWTEATRCKADGSGAITGLTLSLLANAVPTAGDAGIIPDSVIGWLPLDGTILLPDDTPLDGVIIPGVLGAYLRLAPATASNQQPTWDGTKYRPDWGARAHP